MPDISMCQNKDCPSAKSCYRFLATPSPYRQSYMDYKVPPGQDRCDSYSPMANSKSREIIDATAKRYAEVLERLSRR